MRVTFRPLPAWPYPERKHRPATYKVSYERTLNDLEYEIDYLKGSEVIIGLVLDTRDVRLDGMVRANARPGHDGVEVSFEIPDGRRLTFYTDVHTGFGVSWHDNLRAIALGLESLRAVERYGITEGIGAQYAGFAQLPSGLSGDIERGRKLVEEAGTITKALMAAHPDHGGSHRDFLDVQAYRAQND